LKELEELFLKIDQEGTTVQATRPLRSEQQNVESQSNEVDDKVVEQSSTEKKEVVIDTYDVADPEEILSKISSKFYQDVVSWMVY
jgi:LysM repeat protein